MIIQQRQKDRSCAWPRNEPYKHGFDFIVQFLICFLDKLWPASLIFFVQLIKVNNNMQNDSHIDLLTKTAEIILQSRIDPKKHLISHFQAHNKQHDEMLKNRSQVAIDKYLQELLPKEFYQIRQRLNNSQSTYKQSHLKVQILFVLVEKATAKRIEAECWSLELTRRKELTSCSFGLVLEFLKEVILILNKLPLFSIYQKQRELKSEYLLNYKINYDELWAPSLIELKNKDLICRQNHEIKIECEILYLASFKYFVKKKESLVEESKRKTSVQFQGEKRVSVYAFYDPDLDFTFLSSDDEDFHKKGNSESIEIQMQLNQVQLSQEFQLLISNEDEEFLEANEELISDLSKAEKTYLHN